MRLVTWNCSRGPFEKKVPLLDALSPDIAVIQECARPLESSSQCVWLGDNPRQGLAVQATGNYELRCLPKLHDTPNYVLPVEVHGPRRFNLFAVWTHGKQEFRYVQAAARTVGLYREVIGSTPTCLVGDLNSNTIWDAKHPPDLNHSSLVRRLEELGIVSAYHYHRNESHGQESIPTYYFHWKKERPFHIDSCFIPVAWAGQIKSVDIGSFEDWQVHSDHRPLVVEIADNNLV